MPLDQHHARLSEDDLAKKLLDTNSPEFKRFMNEVSFEVAKEDWCIQYIYQMVQAIQLEEKRFLEMRSEQIAAHTAEKEKFNLKQKEYSEQISEEEKNSKDLALKIIDKVIEIKNLNDEINGYQALLNKIDEKLAEMDKDFKVDVKEFNDQWREIHTKQVKEYMGNFKERLGDNGEVVSHVLAANIKDNNGEVKQVEIVMSEHEKSKLQKALEHVKSPADLLLHNPFIQAVAEKGKDGQPKSQQDIVNEQVDRLEATSKLMTEIDNANAMRDVYKNDANKGKVNSTDKVIFAFDEHGNKVKVKKSEAKLPEKKQLADARATTESRSTSLDAQGKVKGGDHYAAKHANLGGGTLVAVEMNKIYLGPTPSYTEKERELVAGLVIKNEPRAALMRERDGVQNQLVDAQRKVDASARFVDTSVRQMSGASAKPVAKQYEISEAPPPSPSPRKPGC